MSYLGYHLHWHLDDILELEHADRHRVAADVGQLNERSWEEIRNVAAL